MTKLLKLEELIDCARDTKDPALMVAADCFAAMLEAIGTELARKIADHLGVKHGPAKCEESAFAGTCAPFYAVEIGQPCPEPLRAYDDAEWSTEDGTDLDPETGAEF